MESGEERRPRIQPLTNGPLVYRRRTESDDLAQLLDDDGAEISCGETAVLCRCGASSRKPFCDGSHAEVGFSSERLWKAGAGKRVDYVGARITVHDNRALCAHVEYCVRELPSVFDRSRRPWIDPDGASVEEIVRICEKCPSGALSYSIDGVEHTDVEREPAVVVSDDGPYFVQGWVEVADAERPRGASHEHCTLCRCGASHNKPFCDGRHWDVGFVKGAKPTTR
ncbi:uncharacterized conserved protein [Coriobacteriaceae bacterium EMTCatB1]|nr:uncharacterized conserved protein [Coriobacteriaceae bacterium EMTCatB1]